MMRQSLFGRLSAIALPTSVLLLAGFFRLLGLARDQRLHPDEALYGYLSRRVGIWGDWQLLEFPVDKPPLFFFTGGVFQRFIGESEFATRLPNAFASLILIALIYRLTLDITKQRTTALVSASLLALCPLDIAFAGSGFTDTQMMLWFVASLCLLLRRQYAWAGLCYGLSIAVKPATMWVVPLLIWLVWLYPPRDLWKLRRFVVSCLFVIGIITLWDAAGSLGSFWRLGQGNYAGGRLVRSDEVWPRLREWAALFANLAPHALILAIGGVGLVVWVARQWRKLSRRHLLLWGWGLFAVAYLGIHWLTAFNLFERYLLPILPITLVLLAVGWGQFGVCGRGVLVLLCVISLPAAWQTGQGNIDLASDVGQHRGIDVLAEVMNERYAGEIFYEHWLGWELNYYLGSDPQVLLLYFATPQDLYTYAQSDLMQIDVPRYFVAPRQPETDFWIAELANFGIIAEIDYADKRYVIYTLIP